MTKYIEREKLIDYANNQRGGIDANDIARFPVADVVEVVRCKDCKHWGGIAYGFICRKFSGIDTKICMGTDQFCSYGERKETE